MSTGKRAYDLLRGYVNHEWDRLRGVEMSDAERELADAMDNPVAQPSRSHTSVPSHVTLTDTELARQILGVGPGATFAEIRQAFDRVRKRADPSRFPEGSAEAIQASEINQRVHRAYAILSEGVDSTEKRFRSLEID